MEIIKLDELSIEKLKKIDAWKIVEESYKDYDYLITPADKTNKGEVSKRNGQVWCLSHAFFFNEEQHIACTMCRGDSKDGPLLWSVWNGNKFVTLMVPPAPDFVLEVEGPINFCKEFKRPLNKVFPIKFEAQPSFEIKPHKRIVTITADGIVK